MINKIIKAIKDGSIFRKAKDRLLSDIYRFYSNIICSRKPIEDNKLFFMTFQGNYTCNPKAITNYILENKLPYKIVWAVRKSNMKHLDEFPDGIKIVRRNTLDFYKEMLTSKVIFDNSTNYLYLRGKKRKGQYLFQTWHGSMGFKKLDPSSFKDKEWLSKALKMDKVNDYVLVNSTFEEDVFRNSFWPTTKFLKVGHPRNDILFDKKKIEYFSKEIRKKYNVPKDTKIALYAPTFREKFSAENYNLDYERLHEALVKRFKGKWIIFVRFHYRMRYMRKFDDKNIINVTDYPDMQELLCASDIGITDYSSWLCDFVLTKRPGFLYTLDAEKYLDERGLCYPLESTPFKVCASNDELYDSIVNFDEKKYLKDVENYLKKLGCYEEGKACKKTLDFIGELGKKS